MKKQYDFSNGKRGAVVPVPAGKTRITIRIDDDVLEWFRKQVHNVGGGSYQALINRALRDSVDRETEPLEETLRRVLHEVLPEPGKKQPSVPKKKPARARKATTKKRAASEKSRVKKTARKKASRK